MMAPKALPPPKENEVEESVPDPRKERTKLEERIYVPDYLPEDPHYSDEEIEKKKRPRRPPDPNRPKKVRKPAAANTRNPHFPDDIKPRKDGKVVLKSAMPTKNSIRGY